VLLVGQFMGVNPQQGMHLVAARRECLKQLGVHQPLKRSLRTHLRRIQQPCHHRRTQFWAIEHPQHAERLRRGPV
jgi:hypothetical protein